MAKLPRYSLFHNEKSKKWELKAEPSGKVVQRWTTKARATKGGVLKRAVKNLWLGPYPQPQWAHPGRADLSA